jgi:hypothetical protein
MAYASFIPTLWSARLLAHLDARLVFMKLVNTDYEGEIKEMGNAVKIGQIGDVTVKDYTGDDIDAPEELPDASQTLNIDKGKYFNFQVKDIDAAQANVKLMDEAMKKASYSLSKHIDQDIASLHADAGIKMLNGTAAYEVGNGTSDQDPYNLIVDVGVKMDENNVPDDGRWIVLPPWYIGKLLQNAYFKQSWQNYLQTGEVAVINGISVLMSNHLKTSTTNTYIMAGTKAAISYAGQISKIEPYRREANFSDAIKGLFVYGRKVVQPAALVRVLATSAS